MAGKPCPFLPYGLIRKEKQKPKCAENQPPIPNVESRFGQPHKCDKTVTIRLFRDNFEIHEISMEKFWRIRKKGSGNSFPATALCLVHSVTEAIVDSGLGLPLSMLFSGYASLS